MEKKTEIKRNYKKENKWANKKYEQMNCRIEKKLGTEFKKYLTANDITFANWLRKKIEEELKK